MTVSDHWSDLPEDLSQLRAENERLTAALKVIAELPPGSQRAYGKFAEAQQIAKRELAHR